MWRLRQIEDGACLQVQVPKPDVVITSFEALVSDAAALKALSWDFVIVDERTRMQSALSRAYQAVYGIHCRARAIVAHSSVLKTVCSLIKSCQLCTSDQEHDPEQ